MSGDLRRSGRSRFAAWLVAASVAGLVPISTAVNTGAVTPGPIYLVTSTPNSLPAGDIQIRSLLTATGRTVVNVDDDTVTAAGVAGGDLVVLSSSVVLTKVGGKLADVPVPLITWEGFLHRANKLAIAGGETSSTTRRITITNPTHPIAAGQTASPLVTTTANKLSWGTIAPTGTIIATVPGQPARATVFVYNQGDLRTDATPAPSCRVGLFPDYQGANKLNTNGAAIVTAAIAWALNCAAPPTSECETPSGDPIPTDLSESECVALIALYNATDGPNWDDNTGWLTTTDPCTWAGVTCNTEVPDRAEPANPTVVTQLNLYSNQLSGTIPDQLADLAALENLDLSENQLTGTIPSGLAGLTNLHGLILYGNQLTGTIPTELGGMTNLRGLNLGDNQLTGTIPTELGGMTSLNFLYLYDNQLTGAIPAELGNLVNMNFLYLYGNQLTGTIPTELGNLDVLEFLLLHDNSLSGDVAGALGDLLDTLQVINLVAPPDGNCFSSSSSTVATFLDTNDPDWDTCPTPV